MVDQTKRIDIIIMDDDPAWCEMISTTAQMIGHHPEWVTNLDDAHARIQEAFNVGNPYEVAVIDLNFETGKYKTEVPRGKETLRFIKTRHPYMACIVVSGVPTSAGNVLDLRDDYNMDYYIQKDKFDLDTFANAISKSLRRVEPLSTEMLHKSNLERTIEKWQNVRLVLLSDLANVRERAALKGIDVDVTTQNEIKRYEQQLEKVERQIKTLQEENKT